MRVVFMGTPDFAVPSLQILLDHGYEVCAVYTQPDKPKGRGHKLQPPPVKELALQHQIPVFQPATLRKEEVQAEIRSWNPDVIVVVAYGKLLPKAVLDAPKLGCVNVHGSLLPQYRGAAPIQWTVLNGDKVAGVTTMFMAEGMDTGDMLLKAETPVGEEETSGQLFDRLKDLGADLLLETLQGLEAGTLTSVPQDEAQATRAPMLSKELSQVDWTKSAQQVHDLIRGLNPWPSAVSYLDGRKLKLHASRVREGSGEAGKAFAQDGALWVYCGQGALELTEIQTENGKRMDGKSYLLGHPLQEGSHFGGPENG
ncbi:MAG TPA: methionyl-tRNA formyltransferase [Candidatus Acutalibacter pullicola]|uniref:Methionyl-tRNA formyltransferase n=1 Tax=Candidatus Acutalibacter pullicola TaxID=2838417 RepID=A0A9D2MW54_9FIRM|nr:methionyl-tRNA formyltransferase [Candidatus Acutalibacter pullicola]